jgi:hypothetical protein
MTREQSNAAERKDRPPQNDLPAALGMGSAIAFYTIELAAARRGGISQECWP